MSRNYYSEINLHFVWHCKDSMPLLTPEIERLAHRFIRKRIVDTPGAFVHEIGGTETHVHIAVSVPPTLAPSEFVGQLKGGSSHDVNQELGRRDKVLQWQAGYGIVSFGTRDLEWVRLYIRNQREHHANGTVHDRLERITEFEADVSPALAQAVSVGRPVNGPE
ncbi:MAG TPA: IS200/IS605 family transposase [Lacipirellulaceae bacterium]|jgi:putative transposase|nr:IS200/IS605 family transposase [Lacipirellulaceae bacterium]